jgi:hypothetical protein
VNVGDDRYLHGLFLASSVHTFSRLHGLSGGLERHELPEYIENEAAVEFA